jgi:osmotically inducible protein OsmC
VVRPTIPASIKPKESAMKKLYTAHAISIGGRAGHVETDDKRVSFDLTPSQSTTGTNPEQLFACGYAACFGSAIDAVAKKQYVETGDVTVKIDVDLNQDDDNGYFLAVTLDVTLAKLDKAQAEKLVQAAHQVCPYSKATRGNVEVTLKASGEPLPKAA